MHYLQNLILLKTSSRFVQFLPELSINILKKSDIETNFLQVHFHNKIIKVLYIGNISEEDIYTKFISEKCRSPRNVSRQGTSSRPYGKSSECYPTLVTVEVVVPSGQEQLAKSRNGSCYMASYLFIVIAYKLRELATRFFLTLEDLAYTGSTYLFVNIMASNKFQQ